MATYGLVENGVVIEVISAVDSAEIDGKYHADLASKFILDANNEISEGWTHNGTVFAAPIPYAQTWADVRTLQTSMIEDVTWHVERHFTQRELGLDTTTGTDITAVKYQEYLQYIQDIREDDDSNHATPDLAITALEGLTAPV